jgi:hypothetical protein
MDDHRFTKKSLIIYDVCVVLEADSMPCGAGASILGGMTHVASLKFQGEEKIP